MQDLTLNQELIGVLTSQWFDYGLPPGKSSFVAHAALVNGLVQGACFPKHGADSIARNMIPLVEEVGGAVCVGEEKLSSLPLQAMQRC